MASITALEIKTFRPIRPRDRRWGTPATCFFFFHSPSPDNLDWPIVCAEASIPGQKDRRVSTYIYRFLFDRSADQPSF